MSRSIWYILFPVLCACQLALAVENQFINPPPGADIHEYADDNVYAIGSTIGLLWTTNYQSLSLVLWQNNNASSQYILQEVPAVTTHSWHVDLTGLFDLNAGHPPGIFFMQIFDEGGSGDSFSSHYFNITDTGSSSSKSSTSASTSQTKSTSAPTNSKTSSTGTSSSQSSGLSSGAKIGIGVGVGAGVVCLLIGVAIGFCFRRKHSKPAQGPPSNYQEIQSGGKQDPSLYQGSYQSQIPGSLDHNASGYSSPLPQYNHAHAPAGYQGRPQADQSRWSAQELQGNELAQEMQVDRPPAELSPEHKQGPGGYY